MKESNNDYYINKITEYNDIFNTLIVMSNEYSPPLINKIINLYEYTTKLVENAEVYIAKRQEILGYIAFYCNDIENKIAYITQIAVKSSYQLKGLGKRLINISYSIAVKRGMEQIMLEVDKLNEKAIRFYENEGFYYLGVATPNSIFMIKDLKRSDKY